MFGEQDDLDRDDDDEIGSTWPIGRCVTAEEFRAYEIEMSRFEQSIERLAPALEYFLRVFLFCEANYDPNDGDLRYHWDTSYYWLTYYADEIHVAVQETEADAVVKRRAQSIWPGSARRCRMARPYLHLGGEMQTLYDELNASYWRFLDLMIEGRRLDEDPRHDELAAREYGEFRDRREEQWGGIVDIHNAILDITPVTLSERELRRRLLVVGPFTETLSRMEWQRRKGIAFGPRPGIAYRAGHLIDPHRLSWG